jgi:hypothetical protein
MRKLVVLSALVAATLAVPAVAKTAEKVSFTRDGVTYTYSETKVGKSTIYKGRALPGNPFYLVVRGDQVTGTANGIPVSFDVPAKSAKGTATVAMK